MSVEQIQSILVLLKSLEPGPEQMPAARWKMIEKEVRNEIINTFEGYRTEISFLREQIAALRNQIAPEGGRIRQTTTQNLDFADRPLLSRSQQPSRWQQAPNRMQQAVVGMQEPFIVVPPLQTHLLYLPSQVQTPSSSRMSGLLFVDGAVHAGGSPFYAPDQPRHEGTNFPLPKSMRDGILAGDARMPFLQWPHESRDPAMERGLRQERSASGFPFAEQLPKSRDQNSDGFRERMMQLERVLSYALDVTAQPVTSRAPEPPTQVRDSPDAQSSKVRAHGKSQEFGAVRKTTISNKTLQPERQRVTGRTPCRGQYPEDQEEKDLEDLENFYQLYNALALDA
jgi:hypothetical protein